MLVDDVRGISALRQDIGVEYLPDDAVIQSSSTPGIFCCSSCVSCDSGSFSLLINLSKSAETACSFRCRTDGVFGFPGGTAYCIVWRADVGGGGSRFIFLYHFHFFGNDGFGF